MTTPNDHISPCRQEISSIEQPINSIVVLWIQISTQTKITNLKQGSYNKQGHDKHDGGMNREQCMEVHLSDVMI